MNRQPAFDRRQHLRREVSFTVSYRAKDATTGYDITQTRNLSQGGMLVTTARAFERGTRLSIRLTLPVPHPAVHATAEAVDSRGLVQNLVYETRVRFIDLDRYSFREVGDLCSNAPAGLMLS